MAIKTIPHVQGQFITGVLQEFRRDTLGMLRKYWQQHGDLVSLKLVNTTFYVASAPELALDVLINNKNTWVKLNQYLKNGQKTGLALVLDRGLLTNPDPADWLVQRRMMQPMFHRKRIQEMGDKMVSASQDMLKRWEQKSPDTPFDLHHEMMTVTMDIITRTMFSADILSKAGTIGDGVSIAAEYVFNRISNPIRLPMSFPTADNRRFKQSLQNMDDLAYGFMAERRQTGQKTGDLLDMLLEARDEETQQGMSDKQIRDEVATIFAAGHETTANALSWAWYLMAQNPEVVETLQHELDTVLGGRTPTLDDVPQLVYTQMVFEETLRLYPSAPLMIRVPNQDTELFGYPVKAGQRVLMAIANIHRHPAHWQHPDQFDPQHFSAHAKEGRHRMAYMPFGGGAHMCIGNHFALLEGVLLLATMAQRYTLSLVAEHPVQPQVAVTLRPKNGLMVRLHPREAIHA